MVQEEFERCIELYLCPRILRKKTQIDMNALVPKLPDPSELKPFPTFEAITYVGHKGKVVAISAEPNGIYLASADETCVVIIWEINTARRVKQYQFPDLVYDVQWNKNKDLQLLAVTTEGNKIILINPGLYPMEQSQSTDRLLENYRQAHNNEVPVQEEEDLNIEKSDEKKKKTTKKQQKATWEFHEPNSEDYRLNNRRVTITLDVVPQKLVWHNKGDYFSTVASHTQTSSQVLIHCLSKSKSQVPFAKAKGIVECVEFHPEKPYFFLATQRSVFVYNLQKQVLVKKFITGAQWISSISIHPKGDNFIVGTYDKKVLWFDMDMGSKPYKMLKYSDKAVRKVDFHRKYPLFASCSDDGSVYIFHGMVYDDLLQNALIIPLKLLQGHKVLKGLGIESLYILNRCSLLHFPP